jgi:hypothetical protein
MRLEGVEGGDEPVAGGGAAGAAGDAEGAGGRGGGGDERVRFGGSGGWIRWPRGGAVA